MALGTAGTSRYYGRHKFVNQEPLAIAAAGADINHASGSAAVVTLVPPTKDSGAAAAAPGIALVRIDLGYRVAPTAGSIQASDGTLTWGPFTIILGGLQSIVFDPPLLFTAGATVTVTMGDGGQAKDLLALGYIAGNATV
jgi:hypothetical protein